MDIQISLFPIIFVYRGLSIGREERKEQKEVKGSRVQPPPGKSDTTTRYKKSIAW
jgi:hypothetical protein